MSPFPPVLNTIIFVALFATVHAVLVAYLMRPRPRSRVRVVLTLAGTKCTALVASAMIVALGGHVPLLSMLGLQASPDDFVLALVTVWGAVIVALSLAGVIARLTWTPTSVVSIGSFAAADAVFNFFMVFAVVAASVGHLATHGLRELDLARVGASIPSATVLVYSIDVDGKCVLEHTLGTGEVRRIVTLKRSLEDSRLCARMQASGDRFDLWIVGRNSNRQYWSETPVELRDLPGEAGIRADEANLTDLGSLPDRARQWQMMLGEGAAVATHGEPARRKPSGGADAVKGINATSSNGTRQRLFWLDPGPFYDNEQDWTFRCPTLIDDRWLVLQMGMTELRLIDLLNRRSARFGKGVSPVVAVRRVPPDAKGD